MKNERLEQDEFGHGGDVEAFAKEIGCKVEDVIDLSSNINFVKPDIDIDFNSLEISSYPNYDRLYKAIADLYEVEPDQMELFNGGSSAIFSLFREFDTKNCYIYSPAYLEYKKAAKLQGYNIELINRLTNIEFDIESDSLVVFVNPSTPDGSLYELEDMMKYWMAKNSTILIDESFLDFTNGISMSKYIHSYDKIYILKSMTKFYGSAGIRVATVISSKENIIKLKNKEPLWKISQFDSYYIQEVLKDKNFKTVAKAINAKAKTYLEYIIDEYPVFDGFFISTANFLLVELSMMSAKEFQEILKPYKIMVRDCSNFDFLDGNYVRIAIKSQKQLSIFEDALQEMANEF